MGIGDELMAAGEARALYQRDGKPVMIIGAHGRPISSPVWEGVPYILQPRQFVGGSFHRMINGGGYRPYIAQKTPTKWVWREYRPKPAEIVFNAAERAFAKRYAGMVMIEPNVKQVGHDNKAWSRARWQEVVRRMPGTKFVQCGVGPPWLDDTTTVVTTNFRLAAAVLAVSRAFVGTDGGLMHAAAAVGTPAVILWSEFTSPQITGYSSMKNIRHAGTPCGNRLQCRGCRDAMSKITVAEVVAGLAEVLKNGKAL